MVSIQDLSAGDIFGEISVLDGGLRSAGVEALNECIIASLSGPGFCQLVATEPSVALALLRHEAQAVRRLTTRVYELGAAVVGVMGRRLFGELQNIRSQDIYPDESLKAELLEQTFPVDAECMTLRLSNVTAAFYGVMLKLVGERFGWTEVDLMSRAVFRQVGMLKTREALENGVTVPWDTRACAIVFITAVHSASPEYNINVFEYAPEVNSMRVFGTSRYDRIAKKLDIERHLTWPELTPFFEGIVEELKIDCRVEGVLKELGDQGLYDCLYKFRRDDSTEARPSSLLLARNVLGVVDPSLLLHERGVCEEARTLPPGERTTGPLTFVIEREKRKSDLR